MKKITLFIIALMGIVVSFSQTTLTIGAPANTGGTTTARAPNGTTAHTTLRGHIIITAAEMSSIPSGSSFSGLGFLYSIGADIPASGNIMFYLENTSNATNLKSTNWATAISTMTSVYNGPYTIPNVAGATSVTTTSPFTYTGGGLYVAYDYLGSTFSATAATYLCEYLAVPGGTKVANSATTTAPTDLTASSNWRPEIQFSFTNPFSNNLVVAGMFPAHGQDNFLMGFTQIIETVIINSSSTTATNVPVSLNITGANPYSITQTIASIAPGATSVVNFAAVPKNFQGSQTVVVSVPPDQQTSNDVFSLTQNIYCDTVGYAFGDSITGGLGYNTGSGILANLLVAPAGPPVYILKVVPTLSDAPELVGNTIKGVLLNSAGVIIDSTANHIITAAELGQRVTLTFQSGFADISGDSVYFGFRQVANTTTGYFPLATQDISGYVPADLFCGFNAFGGGYANYTTFGTFLISAVISRTFGNFKITSNAVNGNICEGDQLNLTASPGFSSYVFTVDGGQVQNSAANTYGYTPVATTTATVNTSIGDCLYSATITVNQIQASSSSMAATICPGDSYQFGGQTLTSAGAYTNTIPNAAGCDSVITLNLTLNSPVSVAVTQSGSNLTATASPATASMQWVDCPAFTFIAGETGATYNPTALTGSYAVIVNSTDGCADTSACIAIDQTGIDELGRANYIKLYPNPTTNVVNLISEIGRIKQYIVYDAQGRIVSSSEIKSNSNEVSIDISKYEAGSYVIEISTEKGKIMKSFVKK